MFSLPRPSEPKMRVFKYWLSQNFSFLCCWFIKSCHHHSCNCSNLLKNNFQIHCYYPANRLLAKKPLSLSTSWAILQLLRSTNSKQHFLGSPKAAGWLWRCFPWIPSNRRCLSSTRRVPHDQLSNIWLHFPSYLINSDFDCHTNYAAPACFVSVQP